MTVAVLLVSLISSAGSEGPPRRLAVFSYVDQVRPHIESSTAQGAVIRQVRAEGVRLGRDALERRLNRVAHEARAVQAAVEAAAPPRSLATAQSVLVTTMAVRARAAGATSDALARVSRGESPGPSVDALVRAGEDMVTADRTYEVFRDSLPAEARSSHLPASRWVEDHQAWTRPELAVLVGSLRSSAAPTSLHDVALVMVSHKPPAVGLEGEASVLPVTKSLRLEVVVANTGNQPESQVPVVATLTGLEGRSDSVRDFVDLAPGQRQAVPLSGLSPAPGGPWRLDVVVGPVEAEGNSDDNRRSLALVVRG